MFGRCWKHEISLPTPIHLDLYNKTLWQTTSLHSKVHMLYTYSLTSSGRPCKNVYPIYLLVPLGLFLSWFSRVFWYNCSAGIPGHRCCTGCTQQLKLRLCGMHLCHCIQVHEEPSRNSMEKCMKQLYGWCGCGWGWSVWNAQLQGRLLVIAKRRHHSNDRKILAHLRALPFHQPLWSTPSLQPNLTRNKQSTHRNLNIHWEEREVFHILLHGVFKGFLQLSHYVTPIFQARYTWFWS